MNFRNLDISNLVADMERAPDEGKQPVFVMDSEGPFANDFEALQLKPDSQHHYFSRGAFNCIDALQKMLAYTGPAIVYLATWKINEDAARTLLRLKESRQIRQLVGLIDFRTRSMDPQVYQLITGVFDQLELSQCHAKVTLVHGNERHAALLTSANYTANPRWEFGIISTIESQVDFYQLALTQALEDALNSRATSNPE
ncbi:MAG: hypothetical protein C0424_10330 [Sphingobacteriaceae bacterium]|nr:hypothetical protein [Sphingobacteriaceae bacterium]